MASLLLVSFGNHKSQITGAISKDKPNIIFILTDDQRYDALGAMGNTIIKHLTLTNLQQQDSF